MCFLLCCSVFASCLVCTIKFLKWNFSLCVQCMFFANIHIKWGGVFSLCNCVLFDNLTISV